MDSTPAPSEAAPLVTDEQVLERATALVQRGFRRQLWFLLLDEARRQLPALPICSIPRHPGPDGAATLPGFLATTIESTGASELVIVYERAGRPQLSEADREWLRLVVRSCAEAGVVLRGPLLAHGRGVRWVGPEDLG